MDHMAYGRTCLMEGHVLQEDMSYRRICLLEDKFYRKTYLTGHVL